MSIALECPACRELTEVVAPTAEPVPCRGCGRLLRAPASELEPAPDRAPQDDQPLWSPDFAHGPTTPRRPVETNNPYQSPIAIDSGPSTPSTARASRIDPHAADLLSRWLGAFIDNAFVFGFMLLATIFVVTGPLTNRLHNDLIAPIIWGTLATAIGIQSTLITLYGQSVGKVIVGTKIVNLEDDEAPGFVRGVLLRYWLQFPLSMIPMYSLLDALFIFSDERRCIHDHIASTRVIRVR